MGKVIAKERGYIGGVIREKGEKFAWPEGVKLGGWVEPLPFGGKGDHDGDGKVGGSLPKADVTKPVAPAVVVPADWQGFKAADRKALAKSISGENAPNAAEADKIIAAYVEATKPAPFEEAPAPETAQPQGNGVQAALGTAPDWVAPGSTAPKAVAD